MNLSKIENALLPIKRTVPEKLTKATSELAVHEEHGIIGRGAAMIAALNCQMMELATHKGKIWDLYKLLRKIEKEGKLSRDENHVEKFALEGHYKGGWRVELTPEQEKHAWTRNEVKEATCKHHEALLEFLHGGDELYRGSSYDNWQPNAAQIKELKRSVYEMCQISPELMKHSFTRGEMSENPIYVLVKRGLSMPAKGPATKEQCATIELVSEIFRSLYAKENRLTEMGCHKDAKWVANVADDFRFNANFWDGEASGKVIHQLWKHSLDLEETEGSLVKANEALSFEDVRKGIYTLCDTGALPLKDDEDLHKKVELLKYHMGKLKGAEFNELFFKIINTMAQGKEVPGFRGIVNMN